MRVVTKISFFDINQVKSQRFYNDFQNLKTFWKISVNF